MQQALAPPAAPVADPVALPDKGMPTIVEPATPKSLSSGFDGSGYGSWSGYLQAANDWFNPQIRGAKNEADAKGLQQSFLESLVPELQKRGANVGRIRNEAITIDGREYDTIQDIGGKSAAQLMELGLGGPATVGPMMGAGVGGNSIQPLIGSAGSQGGPSATLQQVLEQLAGGGQENDTLAQARTLKQNAKSQAYERALS